ncbi:MAG TPA: hypothetical protein VF240_18665, partial [Pyrinomonadaceae bacterium]
MPRAAAPKAKRAAKHGQSVGGDSKTAQRKRTRRPAGAASPAVGVLQPKLKVSAPDDQFEREADHVSDRVMSMPAPAGAAGATVGRDQKEEEGKSVQRKEAEEEKQAQTFSLQREEKEEETTSVQRQAAEEEPTEEVAQTFSLQRREDEEEQTSSVQREEKEEEEKSSSLQRKEEEEQSSSLQRRAAGEAKEQMQQRAKRPRRPEITPQFETDLRLLRRAGGQPLPGHLRAFLEPRF